MSDARCEEFRELVSAFVDERLDGGELLRLEEHLQVCAGCRAFEGELRRFRGLLQAAEAFRPLRRPPPGFAAMVAARIERAAARAGRPLPGGSRRAPPLPRPLGRHGRGRRGGRALFRLVLAAAAAGRRAGAEGRRRPRSPRRWTLAAADGGSMDTWMREHAMLARGGTLLGSAEESRVRQAPRRRRAGALGVLVPVPPTPLGRPARWSRSSRCRRRAATAQTVEALLPPPAPPDYRGRKVVIDFTQPRAAGDQPERALPARRPRAPGSARDPRRPGLRRRVLLAVPSRAGRRAQASGPRRGRGDAAAGAAAARERQLRGPGRAVRAGRRDGAAGRSSSPRAWPAAARGAWSGSTPRPPSSSGPRSTARTAAWRGSRSSRSWSTGRRSTPRPSCGRVPPDVTVVEAGAEPCLEPAEAERLAGLPVALPAYLPEGFERQCIRARRRRDYGEIQVVFGDGLSLLSLFESTSFREPAPTAGPRRRSRSATPRGAGTTSGW